MIWLRRECCSSVLHIYNRPGQWGDDDWIARSMIIIIKDDDDMMTWLHDFMMTWWQTWLEGKTRWPLVDWGAVRDSVLEGDRCCAKRYRKWQSLNSWLNIYASEYWPISYDEAIWKSGKNGVLLKTKWKLKPQMTKKLCLLKLFFALFPSANYLNWLISRFSWFGNYLVLQSISILTS